MDRLLSLINPKYMFLGEKDFQQLFLIKNYVKNKFKLKIISCKTIRDKNYIALSSRNYLLSKKKLNIASQIAKKMRSVKTKVKNNPNLPKKCIGLFKYLSKKIIVKKS